MNKYQDNQEFTNKVHLYLLSLLIQDQVGKELGLANMDTKEND